MAQDPKLQALANHINARLAQPSLPPLPPLPSSTPSNQGLTGPAPSLGNTGFVPNQPLAPTPPLASTLSVPAALAATNQTGVNQVNGMEGYFQNESQAILKQQRDAGFGGSNTIHATGLANEQPSKKKILLMGVYVGGAVFLISFIILVAIRPRFVMKKVKKENGTEELKCNFLAIFLISLALLIIVLVTAGISAAKGGK